MYFEEGRFPDSVDGGAKRMREVSMPSRFGTRTAGRKMFPPAEMGRLGMGQVCGGGAPGLDEELHSRQAEFKMSIYLAEISKKPLGIF